MRHPLPTQEPDDVPRGTVLLVAAAAIAIGAASVAAGGAVALRVSQPPPAPPPAGVEQSLFDVAARGRAIQAQDRVELDRYGWADRDEGIATIPIDRAIDIIVEESR